jgi:Tol biopolymer transport system component
MRTLLARATGVLTLAAFTVGPIAPAAAHERGHDKGSIVFTGQTAGGSQLSTVRPDGSHLRQITHVDGSALHPDWSPDGRQITFEWDLPDEATAVIAVIDADGGNLRVPGSSAPGTLDFQPVFSADGRRIIFERFDGGHDDSLFSMRLDGTGLRRLTTAFPDGQTDPNVSPDGRHLSFVRTDKGVEFQQALTVSDADGSHQHDLVPPSFDVGVKQAWSPDSKRLVFTRDADSHANVATIAADGSDLRMVTDFPVDGRFSALAGSYSPDGRWIVFRLEDQQAGTSGLYRIRADGRHLHLIISISGVTPRYIDWGGRS